jgi:mannose-6-phosphate isomerase-like protein (cupin superfamily)
MDAIRIKKEIESAREKRVAAFFKNLIPEVPSWDNFIEHIDFQYKNKNIFSEEEMTPYYDYLGGIMMKKNHDFYLQTIDAQNLKIFPQVNNLILLFNEVYNEKTGGGGAFVNFVGNQPLVPMHADKWDSVFWHCLGKATWTINLKMEDKAPNQTFDLEPGDVIVIPVGVLHSVYNPVPRAGIAMAYNKKEE